MQNLTQAAPLKAPPNASAPAPLALVAAVMKIRCEIPEVLMRISDFVEAPSYARVIKHMHWSWCERNARRTGQSAVTDPEVIQKLLLGVVMLTKYDHIDTRVLDYCFSEKTTLTREDASIVCSIGQSGNLNLIEWTFNHFRDTVGVAKVLFIGAYEACQFEAMNRLAPATYSTNLDRLFMKTQIDSFYRTYDTWYHRSTNSSRFEHPLGIDWSFGAKEYMIAEVECAETKIMSQRWRQQILDPTFSIPEIFPSVMTIEDEFEWVIRYEQEQHCLTSNMADKAAEHNFMNLLRWMYAKGVHCTQDGFDRAALNGHLDILLLLYVNGSRGSKYANMSAVFMEHIDVVRWFCRVGMIKRDDASNLTRLCSSERIKIILQDYSKSGFVQTSAKLQLRPLRSWPQRVLVQHEDCSDDEDDRPTQRRRFE